jgi:hypothetical protein
VRPKCCARGGTAFVSKQAVVATPLIPAPVVGLGAGTGTSTEPVTLPSPALAPAPAPRPDRAVPGTVGESNPSWGAM